MKNFYLLLLIGLFATTVYAKKKMSLFSPDKTIKVEFCLSDNCLLYTSPSPRDTR